jgi:hypothetical protein
LQWCTISLPTSPHRRAVCICIHVTIPDSPPINDRQHWKLSPRIFSHFFFPVLRGHLDDARH